eukprot:TRINITY_DN90701_c0_g1_i1.p1 TRINITY_DN90701_c0_g1~~TRINITY_DN90701_c0_g1_i1.p1  ORF type:complete len:649 (+),score=110.64 TRINITY_DN90701_c0_g1_i1:86-2032(+)
MADTGEEKERRPPEDLEEETGERCGSREKCSTPNSLGVNSINSLIAEPERHEQLGWLSNPYVWWRHPVVRLLIVVLIFVQDFYLYGEDPVNDSHIECNLPGLGHVFNLANSLWRFPDLPAGVQAFRVILVLLAVLLGAYFGRQWVHHRFLRNYCGLSMFEHCKGTWFCMGGGIIFAICVAVGVHNVCLSGGGDEAQLLTGATGMEMRTFGKLTQTFSGLADIVAIVQVSDAVFQDRHHYWRWAASFKCVYIDARGGWVRVATAWVLLVGLSTAVVFAILSTGKDPDDMRWEDRRIGGLSEVGRTALLSSVIFCDLLTVVQDWEFPTFQVDLQADVPILVAGTFSTSLKCDLLSRFWRTLAACLGSCWCPRLRLPAGFYEFWKLEVTGGWLAYGPLICVVALDFFCTRTQIMYEPKNYGQYVDINDQRIWTIIDADYLAEAYLNGVLKKPEMIVYSARRSNTTGLPLDLSAASDVQLNSRYIADVDDWALPLKWLLATPGTLMVCMFAFFVAGGERAKRFERAAGERAHRLERLAQQSADGVNCLSSGIGSGIARLNEVGSGLSQEANNNKLLESPSKLPESNNKPFEGQCTTCTSSTADSVSSSTPSVVMEKPAADRKDAKTGGQEAITVRLCPILLPGEPEESRKSA